MVTNRVALAHASEYSCHFRLSTFLIVLSQRTIYHALGDLNLRDVPKGDVLQLERRGYYIVDEPWDASTPDKPAILFNIPDGRTKNM